MGTASYVGKFASAGLYPKLAQAHGEAIEQLLSGNAKAAVYQAMFVQAVGTVGLTVALLKEPLNNSPPWRNTTWTPLRGAKSIAPYGVEYVALVGRNRDGLRKAEAARIAPPTLLIRASSSWRPDMQRARNPDVQWLAISIFLVCP